MLRVIGEEAKLNFLQLQGQRRVEKEFLAYDITSISSYSTSLKQVKYGLNKENDSLPQINLALLFGENSRLPVYYRKLPGNITDVKTIRNLLADINFLNLEKVQLVMDRGFYSEANINALFRRHYKFLISTRTPYALSGGNLMKSAGVLYLASITLPNMAFILHRSCWTGATRKSKNAVEK